MYKKRTYKKRTYKKKELIRPRVHVSEGLWQKSPLGDRGGSGNIQGSSREVDGRSTGGQGKGKVGGREMGNLIATRVSYF